MAIANKRLDPTLKDIFVPFKDWFSKEKVAEKPTEPYKSPLGIKWIEGEYTFPNDTNLRTFRIGTISGVYGEQSSNLILTDISNSEPGNGHYNEAMKYLEQLAKIKGYDMIIEDIYNRSLYQHLTTSRGYEPIDDETVYKSF